MVTAGALLLAPVQSCVRTAQRLLFTIALLSLAPALHADPADYTGKTISAIRFDPPNQPLNQEELARFVQPLKTGVALKPEDVRAAIANLYASGRFDDIAVDATLVNDQVVLTIQTAVGRFIRGVQVTGVSEPPNAGQLTNATKLELGQPFAESQLRQSEESLLDLLRVNGFYQAKIAYEKNPINVADQIDIHFDVTAGKRAKYGEPVVTGDFTKPVKDIVRAARWRRYFGFGPYKQVTETRTNQGIDGIRRSFQKNDFLMARVTLEQMQYKADENRLYPRLLIEQGPKVRIKTQGYKISKGKLRTLVPVYQEQSVDKDLLVEGKRNITQFLEGQGFFESAVDFDVEDTGAKEQTIVYSIDRGERHKLVHLEITGNKYFTTQALRERMFLTPATLIRFRHGRYSGDYLRRDINAIKDLYKANGFRDVDVESRVEDDYNKNNDLAVFLTVKEGEQWFVDSLSITGASQQNMDFIKTQLQSLEGQPFSELNVASDQETVLNYYFNNGFPDATFEVTTSPGAAPQTSNLKYVIHEGERQFVRQVLTSGNNRTADTLIQSRIRNLDPGAPLSQAAITDNQRRLYDLGIFARVDTAIQNQEGDTKSKNVLYRFEEARRYSLTFGFGAEIAKIGGGYSSTGQVSAQGNTGFSPRVSFGISRLNFLGQGHTISLQTRVSNIQRRGLLSYFAPQLKGNENLSVTFSALYDDSRDVNTFNARRQEVSAQLQQRFSKSLSLQYRLAYRRVTVSNVIIQPGLIDLLSQPVKLGIISTTLIQDRRDDPTDPHRGIYNTLDSAFASNIFGSKTSFWRSVGRNATYYRITREIILARSTQFGAIARISSLPVPLPERFFSGGGNSHRGFGESQAGPRDPYTGFPSGGNAVLMNTVELRFPLIGDNIGGVLFHDAGNVYTSLKDISFRFSQNTARRIDTTGPQPFEYISDYDFMVHAVGAGIRYRTPIGPVRVDLAYTVNPPRFIGFKGSREDLLFGRGTRVDQQLSHFNFHFSLGQVF